MRRLFHILIRTLTVLSLLLCVTLCVLWVRSYHYSDQFRWSSHSGWRSIRSAQGSITLSFLMTDSFDQPPDSLGFQCQRDIPAPPYNWLIFLTPETSDVSTDWQKAGFAWYSRKRSDGARYAIGVAPCWSLATLTAFLPSIWIIRRLRSRRLSSAGHCPICNYDLRATPTRCPECGTDVT